jgi:hypothetical protein
VLLAIKDSFAALEYKMRADGVFNAVKMSWPWLLFGQQNYSAEVFLHCIMFAVDGITNFTPNIGGIVSV